MVFLSITEETMAHPEQRAGEVFIQNHTIGQFETIKWRTKRLGEIAYDQASNVIPGQFPVFAQESEIKESGFSARSFN